MSIHAKSDSWAEAYASARHGVVVGGFRLERLLGRGETGVVYEATQLSLGRTVAVRLLDPGRYADREALARLQWEQGRAGAVHHPGLVPLFEAGEWAGGRFMAMRLVRGATLESLLSKGEVSSVEGAAVLARTAGALSAAHRAGLAHGAVRGRNVLVERDGGAYLSDLGLGRAASAEADLDALAALHEHVAAQRHVRRRWRLAVAMGAGVLAVAAAAVLLIKGPATDPGYHELPAPAAPSGTTSLGSDLAPGPAGAVGCSEQSVTTSLCTLMPAEEGRPLEVRQAGVVRAWAVRGASGELSLRVLRPRGDSNFLTGFSQPERVVDPGPHRFSTRIPVSPGDRLAVELPPGAEMSSRSTGQSAVLRWAGAISPLPGVGEADELSGELLLRADIDPGGGASLLRQLVGDRAAQAADGTVLDRLTVAIASDRSAKVHLVRLPAGILLDAFVRGRRTARVAMPDVRPSGEIEVLEQQCGAARSVCLSWRNPGQALPVIHEFRLVRDGHFRVIG